MNRRNFLKSIGAAGLLPTLPVPSFAIAASPAAPAVSAHAYQWAEMIVRAHNKCNLGLLQRSLRVNETVASALKSKLIENGVINAQANAYGIHTATKPLYEGAFLNVSETVEKIADTASDIVETLTEEDEDLRENESEISGLPENSESEHYIEETIGEPDEETAVQLNTDS